METPDTLDEKHLVHDWNAADTEPLPEGHTVELNDETLRDGLQSASITDPPPEQKIELVRLMDELGINAADIGLPGAGPRMFDDVVTIAKEIAAHKLAVVPNCAARTVIQDITPIVEASQKSGIMLEAALFIGSSPIRRYVENWTVDDMVRRTEEAVSYAKSNSLTVMYVTEDTTRADPETLQRMYRAAIDAGADRVCIADTVGHATPKGATAIVRFIKEIIEKSGRDVKIDWHGHRDRGLAIINSMAAVEAGAHRVHGTALGVGERCGNAHMELLLTNFRLAGYIDNDLTKLSEYSELAAKAFGLTIPEHQPIVGSDAFRTCTGVHAAALLKARKKGHRELADRVYSAVPAAWVGRKQIVEIGPLSGASNVIYWLMENGHEATESLVQEILGAAKAQKKRLETKEIEEIIRAHKT